MRRRNRSGFGPQRDVQLDPELEPRGPSKTQLKKAMSELQDLGAELLALPERQLEGIAMEPSLREALAELKRMKTHEAHRRQLQYVGKLMRSADTEAIRRAIDEHRLRRAGDARALHDAEQWRERLLADDEGMRAWSEEHPASDTAQFRALLGQARREAAAAASVASDAAPFARGRSYRELFRSVHATLHAAADAAKSAAPE